MSLYIGCTLARHREIGIDAVVNARGGLQVLNDFTQGDLELYRDGQGIKGWIKGRIRWYGPQSKFFRRHRARIEHLIAKFDN